MKAFIHHHSTSPIGILVLSYMLMLAGCTEHSGNPTGSEDPSDSEAEPAITNIQPDEGLPGTKVTISGSGFSSAPSENGVTFGGIEAKVEKASESELTVVVPDQAESGVVEVTVEGKTTTGPAFTVTGEMTDDPEKKPYRVEGMIMDEVTGMGIGGVEISFSNGLDPTYTADDGTWSAEDLEGPVAISADAEDRVFPVHTRLVLGEADDVDFIAHSSYTYPSNTRIAYQYREGCSQGTACKKPFSIWIMNSNGLQKEQLTDDEGSDYSPAWSPDGEQIAFASDRKSESGAIRIWIMDADGSNLTDTGVEGGQPSWSPTGDHIAYVHEGNIRVMDLDDSYEEIFTSADYAGSPAWSPEGSNIAFDLRESGGATQIWVMEADGSNVTRLTEGDTSNRSPAWEPSGAGILYTSRTSVDRLRIMDPDGSNDRTENWPDHAQSQPAWSPDGKEIVYVYRRMIPISDRIHWIPAEGDAWMDIAPDSDAEAEFWANSPAWAPR